MSTTFRTDPRELARTLRAFHPYWPGPGAVPARQAVILQAAGGDGPGLRVEFRNPYGALVARRDLEAGDVVPGAVAVDLRALRGLLKGAKAGEVLDVAVLDDGRAAFRVGRAGGPYRTQSLEAVDLDELPSETRPRDPLATVELDSAELRAHLAAVYSAAAREAARYSMRSVQATVFDGALQLVGTDGRRLHVSTAGAQVDVRDEPDAPETPRAFLLPLELVEAFLAAVPAKARKGEGPRVARLSWARADDLDGAGIAALEVPSMGLRLEARPVDGAFPNWERVVPQGRVDTLRLGPGAREAFKAFRAIKPQAGALPCVRIVLGASPELQGRGGDPRVDLPDCSAVGPVPDGLQAVGLQPQYALDALEAVATLHAVGEDDVVGVSFGTSRSPDRDPIMFRTGGFLAVVMPLNLDS